MSADLQSRLQAALRDTYRIERELGGGGMSRVFLAEEVQLGRRVVIKVLPPEMGAGVNVERFRREIQLAAKLQHPHIVPLLTAGADGDLLFYVMPFIKGESLRAKLAREGELPVGEASRILKEVVDALAHAHDEGVVHRDIKPDNVLLSGDHAVVTDFGVAKAVSASTGESHLTSLGVALGTPTYMAPEQAAADPHVDHRADIYAVGVLAYEMLSGRPPFSGSNAQQVLSAHMTQQPEPVTTHRDTVPASLNELILRCLAKKPADRWQGARDLIPQLDALLTPSGGVTPTGTRPVPAATGVESPGGTAHAGRLTRIVIVYAAASSIILLAVKLLTSQFALPAWFFPAGVGLLVLGLPIIMVTALIQSGGRVDGAGEPESPRRVATSRGALHQWFTWRRAIAGGVLAFAALVSLGLGLIRARSGGYALHPDVVAVMPFHVVGDDIDLWREGLVDLLATALDGTGEFRASDPRAVINRWRKVVGDTDELPEPERAAEAVAPLGAGRVILGSVIRTGPQTIRVAADLYSVRWLRKEGTAAVEGSEAEMTGLIDRMSVDLLKSVWRREEAPEVRVSGITTRSIPALRAYLQGEQLFRRSQFDQAIVAFTRAVQADSTFAMALFRLATSYGWSLNISADEVVRYTLAAWKHSSGLPERDSLLILGNKMLEVDGDLAAIPLFERLATRYPDDLEMWNGLGEVRYHIGLQTGSPFGSSDQFSEPLERALALDSTLAPVFPHLIEGAHLDGDSAKAIELTARYRALDSTSAFAESQQMATALRFGAAPDSAAAAAALDTASARTLQRIDFIFRLNADDLPLLEMTTRAAAAPRHPEAARADALLNLGRQYLRHGRVAEAMELTRQANALGPPSSPTFLAVAMARTLGLAVDSTSRQLLERISGRFDFPEDIPELALVSLREGDTAPALQAIASLEAAGDSLTLEGDSAQGRSLEGVGWTYRGFVAAAHDSADAAIEHFRRGLSMINGTWFWRRDLARYSLANLIQDRGGEEEALRIYGSFFTSWLEPLGYLSRAQLHERRHERDQALDYYGRFVHLWKDADPHLQPQVKAARQAMARLGGELGGTTSR